MAPRFFDLVRVLRFAMAALTVFVFAVLVPATAQTYQVIYTFSGHDNPANPIAGVTPDQHGNLYGTTAWGGEFGGGAVYQLKRTNGGYVFSDLHDLGQGLDGSFAWGGITIGPNGSLYGTTYTGGTEGNGVIFNVKPPPTPCRSVRCPWHETVLYNFRRQEDGGNAQASVVFDSRGNFYGAVVNGGVDQQGVVYEMTPSGDGWTYQVLYPFTGGTDGSNPDSLLTFDAAGSLYGSALAGGNSGCVGNLGCGTIFKISRLGGSWAETTLYTFTDGSDGSNPQSGVIFDAAGNIYSATGASDGALGGSVFELTAHSGSYLFNLITDLRGGGPGPWNPLLRDSGGNLYGATWGDGLYGAGNVFKLTPTSNGWVYTDLHDFTGGADGGNAFGGLSMDSEGNIFGTTYMGGLQSCGYCGVVFEITP